MDGQTELIMALGVAERWVAAGGDDGPGEEEQTEEHGDGFDVNRTGADYPDGDPDEQAEQLQAAGFLDCGDDGGIEPAPTASDVFPDDPAAAAATAKIARKRSRQPAAVH